MGTGGYVLAAAVSFKKQMSDANQPDAACKVADCSTVTVHLPQLAWDEQAILLHAKGVHCCTHDM